MLRDALFGHFICYLEAVGSRWRRDGRHKFVQDVWTARLVAGVNPLGEHLRKWPVLRSFLAYERRVGKVNLGSELVEHIRVVFRIYYLLIELLDNRGLSHFRGHL